VSLRATLQSFVSSSWVRRRRSSSPTSQAARQFRQPEAFPISTSSRRRRRGGRAGVRVLGDGIVDPRGLEPLTSWLPATTRCAVCYARNMQVVDERNRQSYVLSHDRGGPALLLMPTGAMFTRPAELRCTERPSHMLRAGLMKPLGPYESNLTDRHRRSRL
jgi:hypothetical protein